MNNKKRKRLASIVALGGITLALIIIFAAQKSGNKNGAFVGLGVFAAACVATVILDTTGSGKAKSTAQRPGAGKYDPLLLDERTKQDTEVRRLLQYTEVQKAFFDPNYLGTAEAQSAPNIQELLAVFDRMLLTRHQSGNGDLYPNQNTLSPFAQKQKQKPRHVIGALIALVGMMLLITPFVLMFVFAATDAADGDLSSLLFIAAPVGLVLIIVGSIIGRR